MKPFLIIFIVAVFCGLVFTPAFAKEKCNFIGFNKTRITNSDGLELKVNRCLEMPFNELSVQTPNNRYYFISNENPGPASPTIYSKEQFSLIKMLVLDVKSLTAAEYRKDAKPEKIFVEKGYYKFRFGDELQTDVDYPIFEKDIYYSPDAGK